MRSNLIVDASWSSNDMSPFEVSQALVDNFAGSCLLI
jgi:hypothetical protein